MTNRSLPERIEQRFAAYGHQNDLSAWEIGWLTVWTFDHCARTDETGNDILVDGNEEEIKVYELYNIIAKATQKKSPHSIRNWHGVAKNVSPKLKEDFELGLSHWKAIIPLCNNEKELRKVADIVESWAEKYGGEIISVAALRRKLSGNGKHELDKDGVCIKCGKREEDGPCIPAPLKWERSLKTATNACSRLVADEATPGFVRDASKRYINATAHPPLP